MRRRPLVLCIAILAVVLVLFAVQGERTGGSSSAVERDVARASETSPAPALAVPAPESDRRSEPLPAPELEPVPEDVQAVVPSITGTVTLSDGTVMTDMRLLALHPAATPGERRLRPGEQESEEVLERVSTDSEGRFSLALGPALVASGGFYLYRDSHSYIGQNLAVYALPIEQPIAHVLPGGALDVRVVDGEGRPVDEVVVAASFADRPGHNGEGIEPRKLTTHEDGRVRFLFLEPAYVTLTAQVSATGAFAALADLPVSTLSPNQEVTLTLSMLDRPGRLRIEVVDRNGAPVEQWAASIATDDGVHRRFINSHLLGPDKLVDGLPLERVRVELKQRFATPPHMYSLEGVGPMSVDLREEPIGTARFTVDLHARLAFDFQRKTAEKRVFKVRYRYENAAASNWITGGTWQYFESGAESGSALDASGLYYTDVLSPGSLAVEVFAFDSGTVEWQGLVQLQSGTVTTVDLAL